MGCSCSKNQAIDGPSDATGDAAVWLPPIIDAPLFQTNSASERESSHGSTTDLSTSSWRSTGTMGTQDGTTRMSVIRRRHHRACGSARSSSTGRSDSDRTAAHQRAVHDGVRAVLRKRTPPSNPLLTPAQQWAQEGQAAATLAPLPPSQGLSASVDGTTGAGGTSTPTDSNAE